MVELNGHDLERYSVRVIPEIDEPRVQTRRRSGWRVLLEDETAMLDDVARSFMGDPVPGRRASPPEIHSARLTILSDNISHRTANVSRNLSPTPRMPHEAS